jgi:hypothetical protein
MVNLLGTIILSEKDCFDYESKVKQPLAPFVKTAIERIVVI